MGVFDKAKQRAEQLAGKAKEAVGRATGDEDLENAGKRDELEGKAKEAGQDVKDRAAGAVEDTRERFRRDE
ncbi:CsbD family protein [Saccharopolyspora subtropica]|uniref:CsbD family protein n=1 Tax=Saccharopolyspora thermophila TaxID=89367 RepID=A0A917K7T4_9PSEU|nr:CsbD family protein [Saccharopolyspora subtropica]GGJ01350.1 CsbD family protein [Saccharopolyspora subtropica]